MKISEERENAIRKTTPLNEHLSRQFGVSVDLASDNDHLRQVLGHYSVKRDFILEHQGEADALQDPDYAKAVLITEMVRMLLREIAPKRSRRKKK
jgi:hypothetical protein